MNRWRITVVIGLALLFLVAVLNAATPGETDNGAEEIMINAGSKGSVFFPHREHQKTAAIACQVCHELFPKEPGSISRLKGEETLKPRQIMNNLCISCHRKTAAAGKPSGPRSCNICHPK